MEATRIGALALEHRFELHELTPRRATLEAAFMELTEGNLEYHAEMPQVAAIAAAAQPLTRIETQQ